MRNSSLDLKLIVLAALVVLSQSPFIGINIGIEERT